MSLQKLTHAGLVPVIRAGSVAQALDLSRALVAGGIRALEITLTVPDAPAAIERLRQEWRDQVLIGAGTVTDKLQLDACVRAGAEFIVTPVCLPELAKACKQLDLCVALGAATPTEVWQAHSAGADLVKVFPASALGGASYLAALRGPFPQIPLMPTGGITLENLHEYLNAGARVVGVGGALASTQVLNRDGAGALTELARRYCEIYQQHVNKHH